MSSTIEFPYDPTGTAASNLIQNEIHAVTPPELITDASVIIPRAAPFFAIGLVVSVGTPSNLTPLTRNVDYVLVYKHRTASKATGLDVFGGILLTNRNFSTNVYVTIQTIGGALVLDDVSIVESFSRSLHNVMYVSWEQFTGLPSEFPVSNHPIDGEQVYNMANVSAAVNDLAASINASNTESGSEPIAVAHAQSNTAHTPSQVGLGAINNWPIATNNDYITGTVNTYANAYGVKTYMDARLLELTPEDITDRIAAVEATNQSLVTTVDALVVQNNGIADAISDIESNQYSMQQNINTNSEALGTLTATVTDLSADYGATSAATANNTAAVNAMTTDVNALKQDKIVEDATDAANLLRGEIPNGTYPFVLEPGHQKDFVVVSAGGRGGKDIVNFMQYRQPRESRSFKLYVCTDRSDGSALPKPQLLATVACGSDGDYANSADTLYGAAGAGGVIDLDDTYLTVTTETAGVAGEVGSSSNSTATLGGDGIDLAGVIYGKGLDGEQYAGAGGGGAHAVFNLNNNTTFPLKFIMVVNIMDDTATATQQGYLKITHTSS